MTEETLAKRVARLASWAIPQETDHGVVVRVPHVESMLHGGGMRLYLRITDKCVSADLMDWVGRSTNIYATPTAYPGCWTDDDLHRVLVGIYAALTSAPPARQAKPAEPHNVVFKEAPCWPSRS